MEFHVLGSFEACADGQPVLAGTRRQERLLLAGQIVPVARLADLLWDGTPPDTARGAIHTYIGRLRRTLAPHSVAIRTRGEGYLIDPNGHTIDAARFTDLAHRAAAE